MNNSPYLDKPLVPLAVALRSMLAETEVKIATATPAEKETPPAACRGAARVGYAETNNPSLDLAAHWAELGDPGSA
jgi:hypothetical protein